MSLEAIRRTAQMRLEERGLPRSDNEEWRFSPIGEITGRSFAPAAAATIGEKDLESLLLSPLDAYRLVFSNGRWMPSFSAKTPGDLMIGSVKAGVSDPLLLGPDETGFAALAAARFEDGPYIRVPKNTKLDKPIHIVYVGTAGDKPQEAHYRGAVVLEEGASAVVIEECVGRGAGALFSNTVTRLELGENSQLEHTVLLREPDAFLAVRDLRARLARNARLKAHAVAVGGALQRCDATVTLDGEGADAELNGLYLAAGKQHFDFHTTVKHAVPHGTSRELYKGVLDGHARAVFNGMIEVAPNAQKTDAQVYNRNLLLSEDGLVNTKPEFKIHANDVQCKHGATIGQLREDALFYLRSRGIGAAQARSLLVHAFASEMLGRMSLEPVREALGAKIQELAHLEP